MILSHRHRFIFIKGAKVAGTSAEIALSQICGPSDIVTPIIPEDERRRVGTAGEARNYLALPQPLRGILERRYVRAVAAGSSKEPGRLIRRLFRFYNHMGLAEVLKHAPEAEDFQILAVERSPYAKVVSQANWRARYEGRTKVTKSKIPEAVEQLLTSGRVRNVINIGKYKDGAGRLRVERPWRMDSLTDDVAAFFCSRGREPIRLSHAKKITGTSAAGAAAILWPDQIRRINELFAEEFEAFGWERLTP